MDETLKVRRSYLEGLAYAWANDNRPDEYEVLFNTPLGFLLLRWERQRWEPCWLPDPVYVGNYGDQHDWPDARPENAEGSR